MTIRFSIHTFGCRVNRVESDRISATLLQAGWEESALAQADIAIINTCTVTGEADVKNRKRIRHTLKTMEGPVLLTGCAINIAADAYQALSDRVRVESDKEKVAEAALELMRIDATIGDVVAYGEGFRTRSGIKIQDGCDNACTYCIVHTARGKAHSLSSESVLTEARKLVGAGAEELVLAGIDLGAWREGNRRLEDLCRDLMDVEGLGRIRISSIEPQSINEGLIDLMASADGKLCRHLHVAMQSGSGKVLHEMARRYTDDEFRSLVQRMRAKVEGLALSTDIIVGFPGETDEDFEATCQMARDCGFMRLHVFPYSIRPGTPAATRADQIAPEVKTARAAKLRAIGDELALADMQRRLGSIEGVVVERPGRGTSESFHEVRFDTSHEIGRLVQMRFTGIDVEHNCLIGEAV